MERRRREVSHTCKMLMLLVAYALVVSACEAVCCPRTHLVWNPEDNMCGDYSKRIFINSNGAGFNAMQTGCEYKVCNDGISHGLFYCGKGECNAAGCNCDGGCWGGDGDPVQNFMKLSFIPNVSKMINIKDPTTWG